MAVYGRLEYQQPDQTSAAWSGCAGGHAGQVDDLMNRRVADLSHVEVLVIDEADRMFDMGFITDVRKIIARVQPKRQSFLFSATMSKEVLQLVRDVQKDPQLIEVGERNNPVESVTQHFYSCPSPSKLRLLQYVIEAEKMHCVLVFSRTKHGAIRSQSN